MPIPFKSLENVSALGFGDLDVYSLQLKLEIGSNAAYFKYFSW